MSSLPPLDTDALPGDITLDHYIPAGPAEFCQLPNDLAEPLRAALRGRGIDRLYTHQTRAYTAVRQGRHLVVVTPTASGKTLCYNLPVLQRILEKPAARALYLFPTKALAQDQLKSLTRLGESAPEIRERVRAGTYDGDTTPHARRKLREGKLALLLARVDEGEAVGRLRGARNQIDERPAAQGRKRRAPSRADGPS